MIYSTRMLASAAVTAFGLALAAVTVAASDGSARGVHGNSEFAALRIAAAFTVAGTGEATPAIAAAAHRAAKGDRLGKPACTGETWPDVAPGCLLMADGAAAPAVRTVTIGYGTGLATTVLVRMPAPQVAAR